MFVLSLSKDLISFCCKKGMGFDKLSPNGWKSLKSSYAIALPLMGRVGGVALGVARLASHPPERVS